MNALLGLWLPLLVAYAPTLWWCVERWNAPTQYFAHCWLVPPLAAWLFWQRRADWQQRPAAVDRRGLWLLLPGLLLHLAGALLMVDSWSAASLVLTVPGAAWFALGRARLRGQWPVLLLVLFVVPAPMFVEGRLAFLLKEIAVHGGSWLGNALGADVVRRGDHLQPNGLDGALYVADACSGLRSLLAMLTLAYCLAFFTGPASFWRRFVLLLLAAPFAVAANVARIAALCLLARHFGNGFAESTGHELANIVEWLSLLLALLAVDALLNRWRRVRVAPAGPGAAPAAPSPTLAAPEPARRLVPHALVLTALALPLVWLSFHRPPGGGTERAERLPAQVAGYRLLERGPEDQQRFLQSLPRFRELLGTDDFVWRGYADGRGRQVFLTALFHDSNWKSVHPPRICIEGSNMDILTDDLVLAPWLDSGTTLSRIVAKSRSSGFTYVTLSVFGTDDWASGDYWDFTWHHLPRALLRRNASGFLLRVEAPILPGETQVDAERRAATFLRALVPIARERLT